MDITIPNLKPGKRTITLKYSNPFDSKKGSSSRSINIQTPKAPRLISLASYAPSVRKELVKEKVIKTTYTDTVSHRQRTNDIVTLWTTTSHGLKVKDKISLSGMGISSLNGSYVITSVPNAKVVKVVKKGANFNKVADTGTISLTETTRFDAYYNATITIPPGVKNDLEWTETLKDVVFFLYEAEDKILKYVDADISNGGTLFTTTVPAYPNLSKKRANIKTRLGDSNYKFRYVIVRYYKDAEDNWIGYFPMLKKDSVKVSSINDIIVSSAGVL